MKTTVVGNYPKIPNRPRPARLRRAIAQLDRGEITRDDLARVADEVTIEAIQEQVDAGIDLITDGQIRWEDDQTYIMRALKGVEIGGLIRYFDTNTYYRQPEVVAPVAWQGPILVRDYEFAVEHSAKPVKPVLTGPYTLAALSLDKHYGGVRKLALALADELRSEVRALAEAGASLIQISEPAIVLRKDDVDILCEALARLLDGIDAEIALYTWFGDLNGILPRLLDLPVDTIGLDFARGPDNWEALKGVRFDKKLGLGIVDARNTKLETLDQIDDAIRRVSEFVPPERLYVNPTAGLEYLPREAAFEKLKRMVEGARKAQGVTA
jgi:5-methyltetrahydropteroyltriglutamate--homocysteine methyltransferase